jgi:xylitol oxidase
MTDANRNWAGNIAYATATVQSPRTVLEVQEAVQRARRVRALGSRHSFNRIADTDGTLVSLRHLNRLVHLDPAARTVTIEGGITYGELAPLLDAQGFALPNLASLPHISVVGAATTATHGSGNGNRNLATSVCGLEIVTGNGDIVSLTRGDAGFDGAVVGLGALGIVVRATLDIVPRFEVRQNVYLDLPFEHYVEDLEAITGSAYSVSAFTHWTGDNIAHIWLKSLANTPARSGDFFGARPASKPYHPIETIDPAPATEQLGVAGPWYERLPHFRMAFTPSVGAELQTEYFVPFAEARAALRAVRAIQEQFAPLLLVSELRTIAADELWLSMTYRQPSLAFHFTWRPDWPAVRQVLPAIETALAPFAVRPHWGKLFTLDKPTLQSRYERLAEFRALADRHDPGGRFRNAFLDETVF